MSSISVISPEVHTQKFNSVSDISLHIARQFVSNRVVNLMHHMEGSLYDKLALKIYYLNDTFYSYKDPTFKSEYTSIKNKVLDFKEKQTEEEYENICKEINLIVEKYDHVPRERIRTTEKMFFSSFVFVDCENKEELIKLLDITPHTYEIAKSNGNKIIYNSINGKISDLEIVKHLNVMSHRSSYFPYITQYKPEIQCDYVHYMYSGSSHNKIDYNVSNKEITTKNEGKNFKKNVSIDNHISINEAIEIFKENIKENKLMKEYKYIVIFNSNDGYYCDDRIDWILNCIIEL